GHYPALVCLARSVGQCDDCRGHELLNCAFRPAAPAKRSRGVLCRAALPAMLPGPQGLTVWGTLSFGGERSSGCVIVALSCAKRCEELHTDRLISRRWLDLPQGCLALALRRPVASSQRLPRHLEFRRHDRVAIHRDAHADLLDRLIVGIRQEVLNSLL